MSRMVRRPPPDEITARQLRLALAAVGYITEAEAEEWARRNALPAIVLAVIAALPQEMQFAARMTALDMTTVPRLDPLLTAALGVVDPPATEAERDDLFRLAVTL